MDLKFILNLDLTQIFIVKAADHKFHLAELWFMLLNIFITPGACCFLTLEFCGWPRASVFYLIGLDHISLNTLYFSNKLLPISIEIQN